MSSSKDMGAQPLQIYPSIFTVTQQAPPAPQATAEAQGSTTVSINPETIHNIFIAGSPTKEDKGKEDKKNPLVPPDR